MSNNLVILQGWMLLKASNLRTETVDGQQMAYLRAVLDTDTPVVGGRHTVVLVGEALEKARALLALHGGEVRVQAAVKGKLLTFRGRSIVQTDDVTFVPAELEVLA